MACMDCNNNPTSSLQTVKPQSALQNVKNDCWCTPDNRHTTAPPYVPPYNHYLTWDVPLEDVFAAYHRATD